MTKDEIEKLTPQERVAGYLFRLARLADLGARLRTKYKDVSTDYSEGWNESEQAEWDSFCDDLDDWFYSIKDDEKEVIQRVDSVLGQLTRAEWPLNQRRRKA